jgi:phospholipase/carboxylesterase
MGERDHHQYRIYLMENINSANELLPAVILDAPGLHKASIIWLHGLGDSGNGFAPIAPELKLDPSLGVKFIFPHAPIRPVTINNGMQMRAWYDIKSIDMDSRADIEGVLESTQAVKKLIENEIESGIDASKIMLIGFSQGGVIAYHLGTRFEQSLAGIVGLSTYMCEPQSLAEQKHEANVDTPILVCHGVQDEVVPMGLGKIALNTLQSNGFQASWKEYQMQHNVCLPEIEDIAAFISKQLA